MMLPIEAAMSSGKILSFQRYRTQRTEHRAQRLDERAELESPFFRYDHPAKRALDARQVAHRRRMLEYGYRSAKVKEQRSK
jgi:hypothetical protein